ncbi:MAG: universal stress protein [Bryobacteraceae bacterium]
MFKKILFPVDFSERCRAIAPSVRAFAERFRSEVVLLHVLHMPHAAWGPPELGILPDEQLALNQAAALQSRLDGYLAAEMPGVNIQRIVRIGDPALTIVEFAHKENAGLIMLPTHGYGPFRRFILGSTAAKVLHDVDCPVWTSAHAEESQASSEPRLGVILCAIDLNPRSVRILRWAASLAEACNSELKIVHAVPAVKVRAERETDLQLGGLLETDAVEGIKRMQKEAGISAEICVEEGRVETVVRQAAQQYKAGLVVLGRTSPGLIGRLRSHDYAIIRESPCPTISI